MKSFLLSALGKRFKDADATALRVAHPNDWLVWEPGSWKPPRAQTLTFAAPAADQPKEEPKQKAGEALALALESKGRALTLGRAEDCDIVINDGTLSGLHLRLSPAPAGGWTVEDLGSRNGSMLDGQRLLPQRPSPLRDGAKLAAAHCLFTFYTPAGLWKRITAP